MQLLDVMRGLLGRGPLDWTVGAGREAAIAPDGVDIIVPVYGAPDALALCLASVAAQTDLARHRVLLVLDGPQEPAVTAVVDAFVSDHAPNALALQNEQRRGFVATVNRGMRESMAASSHDVVLLNSDTVVTSRWLEKLIAAASSSGDVGTVTPLSNHATLCSVPRAFEENLLPTGFDIASFAELIERVSRRTYPSLPTGVGFCLYIRRALLDDLGLFDEQGFGLGYGEENDFCMRALARGWLNVADDATFVYHRGHGSFGSTRAPLQRRGRRTLRRMHPRYLPTIARFMKRDPLADVRGRIESALAAPHHESTTASVRIVHLVHGWPPFQQAGTELYAYWLVRQQVGTHHIAVYTRGADPGRTDGEAVELFDKGVRVRQITNNFRARNPLRRNAIIDRAIERDFERFLLDERPDLLHVHHLAGHAFSLIGVARKLGIPIVLQIQDWWFLCARVNLFDRDRNRCSGPGIAKCARCAPLTNIPPAPLWNRVLHQIRRAAARRAIAAADAYVVGSRAIRDDFVRSRSMPASAEIRVIPYGVAIDPPPARTEARAATGRPIRFGYVGSIAPHKGLHVAADAMHDFLPSEAVLHVWGDTGAMPEYVDELRRRAGNSALAFEGRFREEEKSDVFAQMDVLLVPSVGLESFGLAPREAMVCGVPVIASAGAALSEMFEPGVCGDFFPAGDAIALRVLMRRLVDRPEIVDEWIERLPQPKHSDTHAAEIAAVYESVLTSRGIRPRR